MDNSTYNLATEINSLLAAVNINIETLNRGIWKILITDNDGEEIQITEEESKEFEIVKKALLDHYTKVKKELETDFKKL